MFSGDKDPIHDNAALAKGFSALAKQFLARLTAPPKLLSRLDNESRAKVRAVLGADAEDADEPPAVASAPSLETIVAITRLALTFGAAPDALAAIEAGAPIVVLETGDAEMNDPIIGAIKNAVIGDLCEVASPDMIGRAPRLLMTRTAIVFEGAPNTKPLDVSARNKQANAAILSGATIVGVAASPLRDLPHDLVRAADYRLNLAALTAAGVNFVIGALSGEPPLKATDVRTARETTLADLRLALRRRQGGDGAVDRLGAVVGKRLAFSDRSPRLEDLEGYGEAKTIGLAIAAQLMDYGAGNISWADVTRGLLLEGPPGTGKTTYAKALAKSASVPIVAGSLARWQGAREGHLGHLLGAMQNTFAESRRKAPCVLLIDELDAFGSRESFTERNKDYSVQVVNGLLECLDGVEGREGVLVVATTNHVAMIDPAIVRPGRIDRIVHVSRPDIASLSRILRNLLGTRLDGMDLRSAAVAARGGTGTDCEAWVKRAGDLARRAGAPMTLDSLIAVIRDGRRQLPPEMRRRIAIHEAGHATAAVALGLGRPTSLSVHEAGGLAELEVTPRAQTAHDILALIVHLLAGREAEKLVLGDVSAGAGGGGDSDLARATLLAVGFEGAFGLGAFGPLWLGPPERLLPLAQTILGPHVRALLSHACEEAERMLVENRASLERLSEALLVAFYLDQEEILAALGSVHPARVQPFS